MCEDLSPLEVKERVEVLALNPVLGLTVLCDFCPDGDLDAWAVCVAIIGSRRQFYL